MQDLSREQAGDFLAVEKAFEEAQSKLKAAGLEVPELDQKNNAIMLLEKKLLARNTEVVEQRSEIQQLEERLRIEVASLNQKLETAQLQISGLQSEVAAGEVRQKSPSRQLDSTGREFIIGAAKKWSKAVLFGSLLQF